MRKSLLITSALGLVATALPTLAMAGAAAGSSAAACNSGFFAQFDAKIMNAKLELKNAKNTTLPGELSEDNDTIGKQIKADFLASLADPDIAAYFVGKFSTVAGEKAAAIAAVEAYTLVDISTDEAFLTKLDADAAVPANTKAKDSKGRAEMLRFAQDMRALAKEADLPNSTDLGLVILEYAQKTSKALDNVISRDAVAFDVVAQKVTAAMISENGTLFKSRKIYVQDDMNDDSFDLGKMKAALQKQFGTDAFKAAVNAYETPALAGLIATIKDSNAGFNAARKAVQDSGYDVTDRRVHNHALAGGVGATVGWWQNLGGFALSISGSGDYLWGTFRAVEDVKGSTVKAEDKRRLGFGFQGDVGAHYVVSPSTTLGILVGVRGQQLNFGKASTAATTSTTDSKGDYASKWMINPVVTLQARTFFTDTVYGALSVGYVIPMSEKDFKLDNVKTVDKNAKIRFQGLTGAFSVGMMF